VRRPVTGLETTRPASLIRRRSIQYVPHLHMPPLATVSGGDLPSVELPGDVVVAGIAGRPDIANDRQDVGRKLCRLRLAGHAHVIIGCLVDVLSVAIHHLVARGRNPFIDLSVSHEMSSIKFVPIGDLAQVLLPTLIRRLRRWPKAHNIEY
jgi:hypothetical protein